MKDTLKHKGMRRQLVIHLANKGIKDKKVLQAIASVPRHLFLDSSFEDHAYQDKAFPILAGQTISRPYTVAFQTELLQVEKGDKVLEIGTGSGYQSMVLYALGAELYTIERQKELYQRALLFFEQMGVYPKQLIFGDGYLGYEKSAPYDKIIVTAGAPFIPQPLMKQLKVGGRLVIPVGEEKQVMTLVTRLSQTQFSKTEYGDFQFVPMLEDKNI